MSFGFAVQNLLGWAISGERKKISVTSDFLGAKPPTLMIDKLQRFSQMGLLQLRILFKSDKLSIAMRHPRSPEQGSWASGYSHATEVPLSQAKNFVTSRKISSSMYRTPWCARALANRPFSLISCSDGGTARPFLF